MSSKAEVAALCAGNALGTCVGFVVPLWVAAFIREGLFPISQVGWLASAQLVVLATAGIATSLWGGTFNLRRVGVCLSILTVLSTLLAAVHSPVPMVAGLFLFAGTSGVLHALMIRAGALRCDAPRVLALMTASAMGLASLTTYLSRYVMQHTGVSGLFLMIAGLGILAAFAMLFGFPDRPFALPAAIEESEGSARKALRLAPILACLAGALVNMAGMTVGAYSLVIASALGFTVASATTALALSEPFVLLGALGSHQIGERWGLVRPILGGILLLAVTPFLQVHALTVALYAMAFMLNGVTFAFYIPYAMALVGQLDRSGRLVGALPGLITIGASIGPALGAAVIQTHSFKALAPVAAGLYGMAVILFACAGRLMVGGSQILAR